MMERFYMVDMKMDPGSWTMLWDAVEKYIGPIELRQNGRFTIEKMMEDVTAGLCQLWVGIAGTDIVNVVVTRVLDYPSGRRVLLIDQGGGTMEDVPGVFETLERHAIAAGAHAIRVEGRKGWSRVLPDYREVSRVIEKDLAHGI